MTTQNERRALLFLSPIGLGAGMWAWLDREFDAAIRWEYPDNGVESIPAEADRIFDAIGPGPFDVVGASLGGMVAQHLALRHPSAVRSLVLAATTFASRADIMRDRAERTELHGTDSMIDETLTRWFEPETLAKVPLPAPVMYARDALLALKPGSFAASWRGMAAHDVRAQLPRVAVPVTCVAGTGDTSTPERELRELADLLVATHVRVLRGSHMIVLENPTGFSQVLAEHLEWVG